MPDDPQRAQAVFHAVPEVDTACLVEITHRDRYVAQPEPEPHRLDQELRVKNEVIRVPFEGDAFQHLAAIDTKTAVEVTQVLTEGYLINPPDTRSNTQRIFIPRTALTELTVLAVIGGPVSRRRKPGEKPIDTRQVPMFTE